MKKILLVLLVLIMIIGNVFAAAERPKLALVLSGGAAKGFTHVPIIEELERRGIYPDLVVGTSMGALIGGLYAAGYTPADIRDIATENDLMEIIFHLQYNNNTKEKRAFSNFTDTTFSIGFNSEGEVGAASGILDDQYLNFFINKTISKVVDIRNFDDLSVPYRSVGTNYITGERIVFSEGSFFDALRSSMSIPVMFPVHIIEDGRYLADGGLVDNLPVDVAFEWGADIVIAVDVNEDAREIAEEDGYLDALSGSISQLMVIITQVNAEPQQKLATHLLVPKTAPTNMLAFNDAETFFEIGEQCVQDNIHVFDEVEEILKEYLPMKEPLRYADREYISISSIEGDKRITAALNGFIGIPLTSEKITQLEGVLDNIRKLNNLESISYSISDNVMKIETKKFKDMSSLMTVGIAGGAFLTFENKEMIFYFAPELLVESSINLDRNTLNIGLLLGRRNEINTAYLLPVSSRTNFYSGLGAGFGAYSSLSYEGIPNSYQTDDIRANAVLGITTNYSDKSRLDFELAFDYYHLGESESYKGSEKIWPNENLYLGTAGLFFTFNSHADKVKIDKGLRLDLNANIGFSENFYYSYKAKAKYLYPIENTKDRINSTLFTSVYRMPYELLSSWDYTYFGNPTKDNAYAEIEWQRNFQDREKGLYVTVGLFGGGFSKEQIDPLNASLALSYIPYITLDDWYIGATTAFGYESGYGSIELRIKASVFGQFSISLSLV